VIARAAILGLSILTAVNAFGQAGWRRGGEAGVPYKLDRKEIPLWSPDAEVPRDLFMWARLKYTSWSGHRSFVWYTDYPDSDYNLTYRLHQLTSMQVDPEGVAIDIIDPRLFDYPLVFMSGVGGLTLNDQEADILRRYLLNGGFLFVDDFHGHREWNNFYKHIKKVFPDREPIDIPLEHPIFHIVYDLKEKYQIPNYGLGTRFKGTRTWEQEDWKEVHYCAFYDDKNRMVAFISHNSDLGDGWEEEATDSYYFKTFSEPMAYPIGFNVIVYALTH